MKTLKKILAVIALIVLASLLSSFMTWAYFGDWKIAVFIVGAILGCILILCVVGAILWLLNYLKE